MAQRSETQTTWEEEEDDEEEKEGEDNEEEQEKEEEEDKRWRDRRERRRKWRKGTPCNSQGAGTKIWEFRSTIATENVWLLILVEKDLLIKAR